MISKSRACCTQSFCTIARCWMVAPDIRHALISASSQILIYTLEARHIATFIAVTLSAAISALASALRFWSAWSQRSRARFDGRDAVGSRGRRSPVNLTRAHGVLHGEG